MSTTLTPQEQLLAAGISIGMVVALILIWYILQVIALWKIFSKAGVAGWKSIIPFYDEFCLFKIGWKKDAPAWIFLICSVVATVVYLGGWQTTNAFLVYLLDAIGFVAAVLQIVRCFKVSKAFGHGVGFGFGLLFLNTIFRMILAFGKSEYKGAVD